MRPPSAPVRSRHPPARLARGSCAVPHVAVALLALVALALPSGPAAARSEALEIAQLEQELRELRRTVEAQGRRLQELEAARRGGGDRRSSTAGAGTVTGTAPGGAAPTEARWLKAAHWERLRPGLDELAVIESLGPPTSMRTSDDGRRRTLHYALEIGSSGFLAGHVVLEAQRVVEIQRPRLR